MICCREGWTEIKRERERERLGYVSKHTVIIFNTHSSVVMYCFARVILGSVGG